MEAKTGHVEVTTEHDLATLGGNSGERGRGGRNCFLDDREEWE